MVATRHADAERQQVSMLGTVLGFKICCPALDQALDHDAGGTSAHPTLSHTCTSKLSPSNMHGAHTSVCLGTLHAQQADASNADGASAGCARIHVKECMPQVPLL
jgi:hypothetical protein